MSTAAVSRAILPAAEALLESDALYFEMGAEVEPLEGALLASMPRFAPLQSACVVQRVDPAGIASRPEDWIGGVEREVARRGFQVVRIYVTRETPRRIEAALLRAGFQRRVELGFLFPHTALRGQEPVELREIRSETAWNAKLDLHCAAEVGSDGYRSDGRLWTPFVRAKVASGGKRSFLIESGGEACGSVGTVEMPGFLRMKNLFVIPDKQRRGLASAALRILIGRARARRMEAGIFAVEGGAGEATYTRLGGEVVTRQTEWSKEL